MRIGLDGRFYRASTGGIGRYTRELVKNLLAIDHDSQYVLFLTPEDAAECDLEADNLKKVVTTIKHFTLSEQTRFPQLLKDEALDLVHFLNFNHPLFYKGRYITTIHDLTMNFFPVGRQKTIGLRQAYLAVMKHAASAPKAVIVPTRQVKQDVVEHLKVSPEKVAVIYEGVDLPVRKLSKSGTSTLKELGVTKPYILFVSQWRPHKGLGVLVDAFEEIRQQLDVQLVVTGKPNKQFPEIPEKIAASAYRSDIITPGFVDDDQLDTLYAGAKLFIFPSWYEGFGLPPLEAMARGVAVASSNMSVMPEVLGEAAAYFDPRNSREMARVIADTLTDTDKLRELQRRGFEQAKKYSWRKMAEETLALYRKVLND